MARKKTAKKAAKKELPKYSRRATLSEDLIDKICSFVRAGNFSKVAAALAGIDDSTFYKWLRQGKAVIQEGRAPKTRREQILVHFVHQLKEAEAYAEGVHVQRIMKAGATTWQASAWYLERKHSDRWGRKERIEHSGPDGEAPKTGVLMLGSARPSEEEWEALATRHQDMLRGAE